jgi:hypothetical protein
MFSKQEMISILEPLGYKVHKEVFKEPTNPYKKDEFLISVEYYVEKNGVKNCMDLEFNKVFSDMIQKLPQIIELLNTHTKY